jgi:hypothetical protein
VGGQHHAPAALPPGKTRYPLYRRLGEPQGRSGCVRKISLPPGLDPRTVQLVVSCYVDWTTGLTQAISKRYKMKTQTWVYLLRPQQLLYLPISEVLHSDTREYVCVVSQNNNSIHRNNWLVFITNECVYWSVGSEILGEFAKLRKEVIGFLMTVRPSVCT